MDDLYWIPKEFWEPIKITVPEEYFIYESVLGGWKCLLCDYTRMDRAKLKSCRNYIYKGWFTKQSTKCPFCKGDVREKRVRKL